MYDGENNEEAFADENGIQENKESNFPGSGVTDPAEPAVRGGESEYHFAAAEIPNSAYSDAGYVASSEASAVPPRYNYAAKSEQKPQKERKPRRGLKAAGIVALCLACALLGGICCGAVMNSRANKSSTEQPLNGEFAGKNLAAESTVITRAAPTTSEVSTAVVAPGSVLAPTEIYTLACSQTVGITTEITYTNYFGYTTSGAVSGSGFIISSNGYILTNHHVIEDAVAGGYEVKVLTFDGSEYVAEIVGYEEDNDVAVLKIDAEGLNAVTVGDSDSILVGEPVYAVGNPLGELQFTMTAGMISALDRDISSTDSAGVTTTINMFQVDAAVNHGNSGGPAYNSRGEVIGIITAKYADSDVEGLGFAIPINDAIGIANELITNGYVSGKAYMGVTVQTVSSTVAQYYNMVPGAYIYTIADGSCAQKCGLTVGDIVVAIDDTTVNSKEALITAKKDYRAGDSAVLKVWRSGEYLELTIVFDEEVPTEPTPVEAPDNQEGNGTPQPDNGNNGYNGNNGGFGGFGNINPFNIWGNPFN